MSYIYNPSAGTVRRAVDGIVVAPASDDQAPDYLEWLAWCDAGNEPEIDDTPATEYAPSVPEEVTPRQIRRALNQMGLRDTVEAAVASLGDRDVRDAWEYAISIRRDDPLIQMMAAQLGLDADAVFVLAGTF